jgi:alpha-beta hydrolase superfamily lysophospholipase
MRNARRSIALGALLVLVTFVVLGARSYLTEQRQFFPVQHAVHLPAQASGISGALDVSFQSPADTLRGWYAPSHNHAAVILMHGAGANRAQLTAEARALVAAGFGVLLFDWPGHGESTGSIHWNAAERESLSAAITWISGRSELAQGKVGAYGFSMGGYTTCQVAALDPRLRAVVLAATPAVQREQVSFTHGPLGLLGSMPALYALERGGMQVDMLRPLDLIGKIAPRPVLIIAGTADTIVPYGHAEALYAAAGQPKTLHPVPGAGHGGFVEREPNTYLELLVRFFREALLAPAG